LAQLPYIPDDERFYTNAEEGGRLQRSYQDQMGQDTAQTIRDVGKTYGEALGDAPADYMAGSKYKTGQMEAGQRMQHADAAESRAVGAEERAQQGFEANQEIQGLTKSNMEHEIQRRDRHVDQSSVPKGVKYTPGMTYEDYQDALKDYGYQVGLDSQKSGIAMNNAQIGRFGYETGREKQKDLIANYQEELRGALSLPNEESQSKAVMEVNTKYHNLASKGGFGVDDTMLNATQNALSRTVAAERSKNEFDAGTRIENTLQFQNDVAPELRDFASKLKLVSDLGHHAQEAEQGSYVAGGAVTDASGKAARQAAYDKAKAIGGVSLAAKIGDWVPLGTSVGERIKSVKAEAADRVHDDFYSYYAGLAPIYKKSQAVQAMKAKVDKVVTETDTDELPSLIENQPADAPTMRSKQVGYPQQHMGRPAPADPLGLKKRAP
jgi:hypothetical protein